MTFKSKNVDVDKLHVTIDKHNYTYNHRAVKMKPIDDKRVHILTLMMKIKLKIF